MRIQISENRRLTSDQIKSLVVNHDDKGLMRKKEYYKGDNPTIIDKYKKNRANAVTPNNLVVEPYYRTLSNSMIGYMYSRPVEMVTKSESEEEDAALQEYVKVLDQVWEDQKSDIKNSLMGRDQTVYGVAYELHYLSTEGTPAFSKISPLECIPVYDYSIEPVLWAFIRYQIVDKDIMVDVYYDDATETYKITDGSKAKNNTTSQNTKSLNITMISSAPNFYGKVPWAICINNEETMADCEPVVSLIDFLDNLVTGDSNEVDRFAELYLILKGVSIKRKELVEAKKDKAFNIPKDSSIEYLKKQIDGQYLGDLKRFVIEEIHKNTKIIDLSNPNISGRDESGTRARYKLHDMELLADSKEVLYKDFLTQRNELITEILKKPGMVQSGVALEPQKIEYIMYRNIPDDLVEKYTIAEKQKAIGISDQTIYERLPDIDANVEVQRVEEQGQGMVDAVAEQVRLNEEKIDIQESLENR